VKIVSDKVVRYSLTSVIHLLAVAQSRATAPTRYSLVAPQP